MLRRLVHHINASKYCNIILNSSYSRLVWQNKYNCSLNIANTIRINTHFNGYLCDNLSIFYGKKLFSTIKTPEKKANRIQGSVLRMRRMAGRPEFHCIDRDRHGNIIEPTDVFMLVLTTSKNNVHAQIVDRSKNYKTIFGSFAGNVGFHKAERKSEHCAYRIGENIARKCKRLGIFVVDIKFRRVMRIDAVLQAIQAIGLKVRQLIHEPKIPKTSAHAVRPRRRRRV